MKRVQQWIELCVLFLASLTPFLWLQDHQVIIGHDSGFRFDPLSYLVQLWYSWTPLSGVGVNLSIYKGFLIAQLPEAVFVKLAGSLALGQTLSFVFWFFVMSGSMYLLVKRLFPDAKFWALRLTASIFYVYNFFLLQAWFITERAKFSLFAALPLLILICWNMIEKRWTITKGSVLFGLTLFFLNGGGSPPLYGGILVSLVVLLVYALARAIVARSFGQVWYLIRAVAGAMVATIAFNAYWIIPQIDVALHQYSTQLTNSGGLAGIISWEASVNKYASLLNLFRLQGIPDWYDNPLHPYAHWYLSSPILIAVSFLPIGAIVFVLVKQTMWKTVEAQKQFLLFSLVLLFSGLVLTAGSHPPFGFVYVFLLRVVPGFAIFRSAFYKFGPSVWISTILLASTAWWILIAQVRHRLARTLVSVACIAGVLVYHFPYFTGDFFSWNAPFSTKVTVPSYVSEMFSFFKTAHTNGTTVLLPPLDTSFHADSYRWGYWSLDSLAKIGTNVPVVANDAPVAIVDAMYDGLVHTNMHVFEALAARVGVSRILWRDDVLYSDKTTSSKQFSRVHDALDTAQGVAKDHIAGPWSVYALNPISADTRVRVIPTVYRADVDGSKLRALFGALNTEGVPVVLQGALSTKELETRIGPLLAGNIVAATCMFCDTSELLRIENSTPVPYVRFLPDSPFYPFIVQKERKTLASVASMPALRIDADLGLAAKRLVEVSGLIHRDMKEHTDSLSLAAFAAFRERIADALATSRTMGAIDKTQAQAKIVAYMKFYSKYISGLEEKHVLPADVVNGVYEYLQDAIHTISDGLWITKDPHVAQYYLTIPTEDKYSLILSSDTRHVRNVSIDGQSVDVSEVHLTEGSHMMTVSFEKENILSEDVPARQDIALASGIQKVFAIPHLVYEHQYAVQFRYQVTGGSNVYMAIHQDNDAKDKTGNIKRALAISLVDDGKWHTANLTLHPNFAASSGSLVFFTTDTEDAESTLSVEGLTVEDGEPVDVFAVRKTTVEEHMLPIVSQKQIIPPVWVASVTGATKPYLLELVQAYDPGWRAFVLPAGATRVFTAWDMLKLFRKSSVSDQNHFTIDGFANGWYIDMVGSYDVVFVFWPYVVFLAAIGISIVSFVIGGIVFVVQRKKQYA